MLEQVRQAIDTLGQVVAELDPDCLSGRHAHRLVEEFARGERILASGKALVARRVDETGSFDRSRHRSAAHFVAKVSGTSVAAAETTIRTAQLVVDLLPATEAAMRAGKLSGPQANVIAVAATADPSAEHELVRSSQVDGMKGLKRRCDRVISAAVQDELARHDRIVRERSVRSWKDPDGTGRVDIRGPLDITHRFMLAVEAFEAPLFEAARKAARNGGERERPDALLFDALIAMADAALVASGVEPTAASTAGPSRGSEGASTAAAVPLLVKGPIATLTVRVDHRAFVSDHTEPGERCEIAGVGSIPVSVAQRLACDAFLKALITDGVDVLAVSHLGRTIPAHLRTAIEDLYQECVVEGCHVSSHLELDHNQPVEECGPTEIANLNPLCSHHHDIKHKLHLRLEGEGTSKRFVPTARTPSRALAEFTRSASSPANGPPARDGPDLVAA